MRILVDQDEITIFKKKMLSKINTIEEDIKKMELLKNDFIWEGMSSTIFKDKYDNNIKNMKKKIDLLTRYVEFLDVFNIKYSKVQEYIRSNYKRINGDMK